MPNQKTNTNIETLQTQVDQVKTDLDLLKKETSADIITTKTEALKKSTESTKEKITKKIDEALNESGSRVLVNLASNEYFKSIDYKKLNATIVSPEFKDFKNGTHKIISFYAKRARGLMTRFILENNITDITSLNAFDSEGYVFNPHLSKPGTPVFTRDK